MKKRTVVSILFILTFSILTQPILPIFSEASEKPWSKYSVQLGGSWTSNNSSVRFGSGAGIEINLEDVLDLNVSTTSFRFDAHWRFTKNMRHKIDFSWHAIRRSGQRTLGEDFTIENPDDPEGPPIVIEAGSKIDSFLDIDIFRASYNYSFFQDDRVDLALKVGLFVMPISAGFTATGLVNEKDDASFTAPLPVVGLNFDFAITPKWILRTGTQLFYLEYENFKGTLYQGDTAIEYKAWKNVGFGLGVETFRIGLEAKDEDYPGIDFRGTIKMNYLSALLYVKAYF